MRHKGKIIKNLIIICMIVVVTLSIFPVNTANAQSLDIDYVPVIYDEKNGAYSSNVNDIIQARDGTVYIGNSIGLLSYNGREFTRENSDKISEVNVLMEDALGYMWIGTSDTGLIIQKDLEYMVFDRGEKLDSNCIRVIISDNRAGAYVATTGSLYHFDRKFNCERITDEVCAATISMACNSQGVTAGVTNSGDIYFIYAGTVYSGYGALITTNTCMDVSAVGDRFIFSTYEGEVVFLTFDAGKISCTRHDIETLSGINEVYEDNSKIWLLADNGIGYWYNDEFTEVTLENFTGYYQKMICDTEGNYWIASSKYGLLKMAKNDFRYISKAAKSTANVVNSTIVYRGCIYVGMDSGLTILNQNNFQEITNALTDKLRGIKVNNVVVDENGAIWVATYGNSQGLIRYDGENITSYRQVNGMPSDAISFVKVLDNNIIAAVTKNGVAFIENGQITTIYDKNDGFYNYDVLDMVQIAEDSYVFCTDGDGILIWEDGALKEQVTSENGLPSDVVRRMIPYKEGYILVTSNALCFMNELEIRKLKFSYSGMYDVLIGLGDELWILGNSGIFKVNGNELLSDKEPDYELYNYERGFQSILTSNAWTGIDDSGTVYLCCQDGLVTASFTDNVDNQVAYRISVKRIWADEQLITYSGYANLPYGMSRLIIEPAFTKFGYEELTVSYYLEGYEESINVVDADELPDKIIYNNLPGGEYVFHIELSRNGGREVISTAQVNLSKNMVWYEHNLTRTMVVVVIVLFLLLIAHVFMRLQISNSEKKKNMYRNITKQTVMAIAKTIDAKDEYTNGHSMRVAEYSMEMARRIGMKPEQQEDMYYCGLLHDIGKIGIPDEILNKTAGLTDEEYAIIKTHPAKGAEILSDVTTIPHIVEGAKYHHERFDGKGYNEGLKGKEIPVFARIIAVADTVDAMTTSRCYRKGMDREYVIEELKRVSGKQLDPTFVNVMLEMIQEGFSPELNNKDILEKSNRNIRNLKNSKSNKSSAFNRFNR